MKVFKVYKVKVESHFVLSVLINPESVFEISSAWAAYFFAFVFSILLSSVASISMERTSAQEPFATNKK